MKGVSPHQRDIAVQVKLHRDNGKEVRLGNDRVVG